MTRILGVLAVVILTCVPSTAADLPEFYRHVDSVDWVVRDLEPVLAGWRAIGFPVGDPKEVTLSEKTASGTSESRVRIADGDLSGFRVLWIEPVSGTNVYSRFLEEKGDGVFSLNHRVPSHERLETELGRLSDLGVAFPLELRVPLGESVRESVPLETRTGGRITIALIGGADLAAKTAASMPVRFTRSQYAFIVRDLVPPSRYWASLGMPEMEITHGPLGELVYRGEPGHFDQRLGWQRHGDVTYEWIEPLQGPTVYEDAMDVHGEGFHHFAFNVEDMDEAIAFFQGKGLKVSQSGTWGTAGKPGSGRFAYIDTDAIGGVTIELLWNYRER